MPSQQFIAIAQRFGAGDPGAPQAVFDLAQAGDVDALYTAAEFKLLGVGGPTDGKAAREYVDRAAALGHQGALRAQAYFLASGIGSPADLPKARELLKEIAAQDRYIAVQLAFLDHVRCSDRLKTAERQVLSGDPHIELIPALFSADECRYIQTLAMPSLRPARIDSEAGGARIDPRRDADNTGFTPLTEDLVIQAINHCIAEASGFPYSWGEPLQVVRYRPGQQFRPHHDAHIPGGGKQRRVATALLYLSDAYEGGETQFPDVGLRVRGGAGDLLIFHNLTGDGEPDPRMMHAGLPITRGEKWLATRWIRGEDFLA